MPQRPISTVLPMNTRTLSPPGILVRSCLIIEGEGEGKCKCALADEGLSYCYCFCLCAYQYCNNVTGVPYKSAIPLFAHRSM